MASVTLRGEGGCEFIFDLPLAESIEGQVRRGELEPVDKDSQKLIAETYPARIRGRSRFEKLPPSARREAMGFESEDG